MSIEPRKSRKPRAQFHLKFPLGKFEMELGALVVPLGSVSIDMATPKGVSEQLRMSTDRFDCRSAIPLRSVRLCAVAYFQARSRNRIKLPDIIASMSAGL
jgi:hypothetical protein